MASHPAKIGKYRVEGILGHGGMGVVYKAVDPGIGRYVAIKMILSAGDQSLMERFRSEARSTGALQCPNIVTVYDFGEQDGNPYLVMQYLEGASLDSMIQRGVQLTIAEILGIIVDVCNGLAYAHQRGVIHRDIKPANIMVLQDGVNDGMAVIVDFGIARIGGATTRFTKTDQVIGSLHYMSPEQLQAQELDGRSDVYSTGVVLFQLLTGTLPFDAPEMAATLLKIMNDAPPPLGAYLKEYPIELEEILGHALAKKREDRYPSALDFALDLKQVQERLKSNAVAQLVRRAEAAISREEWTRAREQLQQALRIDRQNTDVQKMLSTVHEQLRQQQRIEQARMLRGQADEAYLDRRYDDALILLDQAVASDPQNSDLQSLLRSVRLSKARETSLQRALRRAEVALQDGDLDEANAAVNEALGIDPQDTQANALKLIVSRQAEQKLRQDQLRRLLDEARTQIAVRDLTGAFATLKSAEALDPASNEVRSLARLAISAQEQEKQRAETQDLHKQIEEALQREDYATAAAKAEEGLRKFPQEPSLLKLKALAQGERLRAQQKRFANDQIAAASSLVEAGRHDEAVALLDRALKQVPGNSELETLRATLGDQLSAEQAEKNKLRALRVALREAKRLLDEHGASSAVEYLNGHALEYGDLQEFREFYDRIRKREDLDSLDARLAGELNRDRRVEVAEEALRNNPANELIPQRLAELRETRARINAETERAHHLEAGDRLAEAIQQWQKLARLYPQFPEFDLQVNRLAALLASRKQAQDLPTPRPFLDLSTPEQRRTHWSATVLLGSPNTAGTRPTHSAPTEAPSETTTQPVEPVLESALGLFPWILGKLRGHTIHLILAATVVSSVAAVYLIVGKSRVATISIMTYPADADITLGGQTCHAPCTLKLPPGKYELRAEREGYTSLTDSVSISTETKSLPTITLSPTPTRPRVAQGTLRVRSKVEGAEVYIDNDLKGVINKGEYEGKENAGTHRVVLKKSGYQDSAPQQVEISNEQTSSTSFELTKLPGTVKKDEAAYLIVQSQPGATVVIDRSSTDRVPEDGILLQKVTPGSHSVAVSKDGYEPWSGTSNAESGRQITVMASLRERLPSAPIAPVISFFNPSVPSIEAGKLVTLSWQTQHADDVRIDPVVGPVEKSGTVQVAPDGDTTYTLTAKASGLSVTQRITISVNLPPAPPPPPNPHPSPNVSDLAGINKALLSYKEAYESMDIGEMKRAWPSLSKEQIKKLQDGFRGAQAVKVEPQCGEPSFQRDMATVKCAQSMTYTRDGRRQPKQTNSIDITLKKTAGGAWVVEKVLAN